VWCTSASLEIATTGFSKASLRSEMGPVADRRLSA
jgi:hypothetical protein